MIEALRQHGIGGDSLRKASSFFLLAARIAGLPLSPHFGPVRSAPTGAKKASKRKASTPKTTIDEPAQTTVTSALSLREFVLKSGVKLTITLDRDVLALDRPERKFVMDLIDKVEEHVESDGTPVASTEEVAS